MGKAGRHWTPETTQRWFWKRVEKTDTCWIWLGYTTTGYGRFLKTVDGKRRWILAHRYVYELLVGQIPEGLSLDHLCMNPLCVNPAHLEPVSIGENILRGFNSAAMNARKTRCRNGHAFTADNLLPSGVRKGQRICMLCAREYQRARWHLKNRKHKSRKRLTLEPVQ